jgi:GNAT superfamily N-acetyltransferase
MADEEEKLKIRITPEELMVEKLTESHKDIIKSLKSYEPELIDFLMQDALNQQNRKISVTYLWFLRRTNELVAYVTLSPDCVKLKNINPKLIQNFRDKGINYKSLPALKIGRLCVDDKFQKRGIGNLIIQFTISMAIKISNQVGCRFLYLDAKRNEDSSKDVIHFYKKTGFELYRERESKETPLYMDLWPFMEKLTDK